MSNPAVINLIETKTSLGIFRIEDNIGEAIHLHLGDIRYDLTIEEFCRLSKDISEALTNFLNVEGFHTENFSGEFLFQIADILPELVSIKEDNVMLEDLQVDIKGKYGLDKMVKLPKSRVIRALKGDDKENNQRDERNYYSQKNNTRLQEMLNSIKIYGYPVNNNKVVLFNDENHIWDGQHRAGCLYYLNGNISIPVVRMYFVDNKYNVNSNQIRDKLFKWDKSRLKRVKKMIRSKGKTMYVSLLRITNSIKYKYDRNIHKNGDDIA